MPRKVSEELLAFSLERLTEWHRNVSAQSVRHVFSLLPVKLALGAEAQVAYEEKDDERFLDRYFLIAPESINSPYFDPFSQAWLKRSYAHSNVATFRKRTFNNSWRAGTWDENLIALSADFAQTFARHALTKAGAVFRIPAIPTAIWFSMSLERSIEPEDPWSAGLPATSGELVDRLRHWLHFSQADWDALFETTSSDNAMYAELLDNASEIAMSPDRKYAVCSTYSEATADIEEIQVELSHVDEGSRAAAASISELAARLFIPVEAVEDMLWILGDKGALVLSGPPGVGKTFIARELASFLANENTTFVQFHPSFSYEYFVSGYRPTSDEASTGLRYELTPGPLLTALAASRSISASATPPTPHVLVIDEINRANVGSVFGEFMSAMEYRDSPVESQYGNPLDANRKIVVPTNFLLIATMNNADRSVGSFDAALRRRFGFYQCSPTEAPFEGVLRSYISARSPGGEHDWIADWIEELNANLPDPEFAIGGSYFFGRDSLDRAEIRRVLDFQIRPYLESKFGREGVARLSPWLDLTSYPTALVTPTAPASNEPD